MRTVVHIPRGTVLTIPSGKWNGEGTLCLFVIRVMHELTAFEDGRVWIEGTRLRNERVGQHMQVLVDLDALPKEQGDAPASGR